MKQGCFLLPCFFLAGFADSRGDWSVGSKTSHRAHVSTSTSVPSHTQEKDVEFNPLLALSNFLLQCSSPTACIRFADPRFSDLRTSIIAASEIHSYTAHEFSRFNDRSTLSDDDPVLFSSRRMAAIRAVETDRRSALVTDGYSRRLAGEDLIDRLIQKRKKSTTIHGTFVSPIVVRTKYFDDALSAWLDDVSSQGPAEPIVLILGAGMDTRSWRLPQLKGAHIIEGDSYSVLHWKKTKLGVNTTSKSWTALQGNVATPEFWNYLNATLRGNTWRSASRFDESSRAPCFVLLEGVSMYLDKKGMHNVLTRVNKFATERGSRLALSFVDEFALDKAQNSAQALLQQWKWGLNGSEQVVRKFFHDQLGSDWQVRDLCDRTSTQIKFGVDPYVDHEAGLHTFYVILERTIAADSNRRVVNTDGLFALGKYQAEVGHSTNVDRYGVFTSVAWTAPELLKELKVLHQGPYNTIYKARPGMFHKARKNHADVPLYYSWPSMPWQDGSKTVMLPEKERNKTNYSSPAVVDLGEWLWSMLRDLDRKRLKSS